MNEKKEKTVLYLPKAYPRHQRPSGEALMENKAISNQTFYLADGEKRF